MIFLGGRHMADNRLSGMSAADIDKETPIPYHYQLRELLRSEIEGGRWKAEDRLPSERELCEIFNLSRTTVRESIDALVNGGLLRREKGRGTFVNQPKILETLIQTPIGFTDSMLEQNYQVETEVLRQEVVPAPATVAHELHLKPDEPVIRLDRLRFILKEPILLVTSFVSHSICPTLVNDDLVHNSLYHLFSGKYDLKIRRAQRFLEAVWATEDEARLLHIEPNAPLMLIESTAYLEDGTPLEYFKALHRGDRTRFSVESSRYVVNDE